MILLMIFIPDTFANIFLEDTNYKTKQIVLNFAMFIWIAFLFNGINLVISAYLTAIHKPLYKRLALNILINIKYKLNLVQ